MGHRGWIRQERVRDERMSSDGQASARAGRKGKRDKEMT